MSQNKKALVTNKQLGKADQKKRGKPRIKGKNKIFDRPPKAEADFAWTEENLKFLEEKALGGASKEEMVLHFNTSPLKLHYMFLGSRRAREVYYTSFGKYIARLRDLANEMIFEKKDVKVLLTIISQMNNRLNSWCTQLEKAEQAYIESGKDYPIGALVGAGQPIDNTEHVNPIQFIEYNNHVNTVRINMQSGQNFQAIKEELAKLQKEKERLLSGDFHLDTEVVDGNG